MSLHGLNTGIEQVSGHIDLADARFYGLPQGFVAGIRPAVQYQRDVYCLSYFFQSGVIQERLPLVEPVSRTDSHGQAVNLRLPDVLLGFIGVSQE